MRTTYSVARLSGLRIYRVDCDGHQTGWTQPEMVIDFAAILVSEGMYRRRVNGTELIANSVAAHFICPGEEQQVCHPAGGDSVTVIWPTEHVLGELGDPDRLSGATLLVRPEVDLAHQLLLARAAAAADDEELAERAAVLVGQLVDTSPIVPPVASRLDHRLADHVRGAIDAECRASLVALAADIGVSAYRLSRSFRRVTDLTVTKYRSDLRTRQALARLAAGDRDLAGIAADVGFADQAHLTRTLRASANMTPGTLRRLFTSAYESQIRGAPARRTPSELLRNRLAADVRGFVQDAGHLTRDRCGVALR